MIKFNQKLYDKKRYQKNQIEFLKRSKIYYQLHKKERKLYKKKYYQTHKDQIIKYMKNYIKLHKRERNEYRKKYDRNRLKSDINFRILFCLRTRIRSGLKDFYKSKRTLELIGCSVEQLKKHLEKRFTEGMTWKNYGKNGWEIDHIKPCASFDLSKPSEQRKCFHYINLQPLWKIDNIKKGNKYGKKAN